MNWDSYDITEAAKQGWILTTIWDLQKARLEAQVFRHEHSNIFTTDEAARAFVALRTKHTDALAIKASKLVFLSRLGANK